MALWRKPLQFINVMLANRSPMIVAERGPRRMTYAKTRAPASGVSSVACLNFKMTPVGVLSMIRVAVEK